jgi:fibronectin type 3 domain-containing protein
MTVRKAFGTLVAWIAVLSATGTAASAQVFGDDFGNAVPGTFWKSVSGNPAISVSESQGVLKFLATQSDAVATLAFAGYESANWRIRSSAEFRMRVTLRSALTGTGSTVGSEVGVGFNLYRSSASPALNGLRPGVAAWLGTRRFTTASYRTMALAETDAAGAPTLVSRLWAPTSNQTDFYDVTSGVFARSVGVQTTLFVRYDPIEDALYLSTTGYFDPDAFEYLDLMGADPGPVQFAIGGFGLQPGNLNGNDTWLDEFRVDVGVVESAPTNVAATDGASTAAVRVTWTAGLNATGYQVLRTAPGGSAVLVGSVLPNVTLFDDTTAVPLVQYTYTVRSLGPSGAGFDASDVGWIGIPAPTGLVASQGASTEGVALAWNAVPNVEGYRVFRAVGSGASTEVATPDSNSYLDTSADSGVTYTFTVRARGITGDGPATAPVTGWRNVAAPSGLEATEGTLTTGVALTWSAVEGATGYKVLRALGSATPSQVGTSAGTGFTDATAVAGKVYSYTVRARTAAGDSAASAADAGWRNVAAPAGLSATDGTLATGVKLTWGSVQGAAGYRVFRSADGGEATQLAAPTATNFTDTTAAAGTVYSYTVKARTAAGDGAAGAADTGWRNVAAPSGLAATEGTLTTGVGLTWTAVPGAAGYTVLRKLGSAAAAEVGTTATAGYTDTTALAGTVYSYTVRATTAAGDGPTSAADTGWRNVAAPSGLEATEGTLTTGVALTWSAVEGATGYKVLRALGSATPSQVGTSAGTGFTDATAVAGKVYSYTVRARTAAGDSAASAADAGWRNVAAPAGLSATDGTFADKVVLRWTAQSNSAVTGYRLLRRLPGQAGFELLVAVTGRTTVTANDTAIPAGVTGTYSVEAVTAAGNSAASATDTGFRTGVPEESPPPGGEGGVAGNDPPPEGAPPPPRSGSQGVGSSLSESGTGREGGPSADDGDFDHRSCDALRARVESMLAAMAAPGDGARPHDDDTLRRTRALLAPARAVGAQGGHEALVTVACAIALGDADADGWVDGADVLAFLTAWSARDAVLADVDRDGTVGDEDLVVMARSFARHGLLLHLPAAGHDRR